VTICHNLTERLRGAIWYITSARSLFLAEWIVLLLQLHSEFAGDLAEHLDLSTAVEPLVAEFIPVALLELCSDLGSEVVGSSLLEIETGVGEHRLE